MSRLKDIFSSKPETMSNLTKSVFGLPLAYVIYLIISMFLPNNAASAEAQMSCQILRSILLTGSVIYVVKLFLGFDSKFFCESGKWDIGLFFKGIYLMLVAQLVTNLCLVLIFPGSIVKNTETSGLVINWIFSFILVTISALCEEIIFRCYIAWFGKTKEDNLCKDSKKFLIYAIVSAVLFTIAHFANPEVDKSALWSMMFYFIFGFCLMLCFFKTKGMEFCFGVHFANNIFAAWFVNYESSVLPTKSLYISNMPISFVTVLQAVICLLFCVFLCPTKVTDHE